MHLSPALVFEYEDVLRRRTPLSPEERGRLLDRICRAGTPHGVWFHWPDAVRDPGDETVSNTAVAAGASHLVTFNTRDFLQPKRFGIEVVEPRVLLERLP